MPSYTPGQEIDVSSFSVDKALTHVKNLSLEPHGVGFNGHEKAAAYIIGELNKMGLQTSTQEGYTAGDWGNLSKASNILARIKGSQSGKALLLLSHYDSSPHSSLGASDAASGVATILEGIRVFLSDNKNPKNDTAANIGVYGSFAAVLVFSIISNSKKKKAIRTYNQGIKKSSTFMIEPSKTGFGIVMQF